MRIKKSYVYYTMHRYNTQIKVVLTVFYFKSGNMFLNKSRTPYDMALMGHQ